MKQKGYQISWWLILMEFCLIIGASFGAGFLLKSTSIASDILELLAQLLTIIPIITGIIILKKMHPYNTVKNMLGICGFDITMLLFFIVMPFCAQYFAGIITAPVTFIASEIFGEYNPGITAPENLFQLGCLIIMACVFAPVFEELLFRGVIMKLLEPYGFLTAALVSSIGFAILHLNPAGFMVILFLGFVLAFIRYISGSVIACMVFHAFSNFYSIIMTVFEKQIMSLEHELIIFTVVSAALFPALFLLFYKVYPKPVPYNVTAKRLGFSLGLVFCIIISIVYLVLLLNEGRMP